MHPAVLACVVFSLALQTPPASAGVVPASADMPAGPPGAAFAVSQPRAAALGGGGFVIAGEELSGPPFQEQSDVRLQRFAAPETAAGPPVVVNTSTAGGQLNPSVAAASDGSILVVWESVTGTSEIPEREVHARGYDAGGNALGDSVLVSATGELARRPAVASLPGGSFVVAWDAGDIRARIVDPSGVGIGGAFDLSEAAPLARTQVALAALDGGGFAAAWADANLCGTECSGVAARLFDTSGAALGATIQVTPPGENAGTTNPTVLDDSGGARSIAAAPGGGFVVGWRGRVRRYDAAGSPLSAATELAPGLSAETPMLAFRTNGELLTAFAAAGATSSGVSGADVFARTFGAALLPTSDPWLVNDRLGGVQRGVSGTRLSTGSFVVVWDTLADAPTASATSATYARRLCDHDADPACQTCPGSVTDADGDSRPDGCDPCNNDGSRDMRPRAQLWVGNSTTVARYAYKPNKMMLKAEFVLAGPPGAFADFDPVATGVRVRIESDTGQAIVDAQVPGGVLAGSGTAGWNAGGGGTRWRFRDKIGIPPGQTAAAGNGITRVEIRDLSPLEPNLVGVSVHGFRAELPIAPYYAPARPIVVLGDQSAGAAGQCGEGVFTPEECTTGLRQIACRRSD